MMMVTADRRQFHKKECSHAGEDWSDECEWECDNLVFDKGTSLVWVSRTDDADFFLTKNAKIVKCRITKFTRIRWRVNALQLRNIKNWNVEEFVWGGLACALLFMVFLGCYSVVQIIRSDGRVDSCSITIDRLSFGKMYTLTGHRNWHEDESLFASTSWEEVESKKAEICPK